MVIYFLQSSYLLLKYTKSWSFKRCYSKNIVRVRFAPSPTGLLHLGGLRTALYNYLFAKSQNGVILLRIEDTDLSRKVDFGSDNLIKDLNWCGIKFDEGPYYQSGRIELYKKYASQLLKENKAYYCFCDKLRLELLRKEALRIGEIPKYDNKCRSLTNEEINEKLISQKIPCIRFKLSPLNETIQDLISNPLTYNVDLLEGDPVIIKADGFPTYHFANVIDDHLMNISHVLRGSEWQISTAKHVLLYRAFNWEPPIYGHIPLILNSDGSKLSKRHGDVHIQGLRENGYFPNAILNFIVRFGGGFNIQQKEKDERIFLLNELLERFDITKLKSSSSKISLESLDVYNSMEIKRLIEKKINMPEMVKKTQEIIADYCRKRKETKNPNLDYDFVELILTKMRSRINKLEDLTSKHFISLWFWNNSVLLTNVEEIIMLEKFLVELGKIEYESNSLKNFLKEFVNKNEYIFSNFMKLLRKVLIEVEEGPTIVEILEILGKDVVDFRISGAIERSKKIINSK